MSYPESFEWLILDSGLIQASGLTAILAEPYNHIESSQYFSWERFFTRLLTDLSQDSPFQYSKQEISPAYTNPRAAARILEKYESLKIL